MKWSFAFVPLSLAAAVLAGCAWVPQKVSIAPQVQIPASDLGHAATVVVKVQDSRPNQRIGYRGMDSKLAQIRTDQDLAPIFQQKIIEGLSRQGFKALPASDGPARVLKVDIRELHYSTDTELWQGTVRTRAAVQAYSRTEDTVYSRLYEAEREEKAIEAPGAKTNARLINGAISDVLQRLLEDQKLIKMLAD